MVLLEGGEMIDAMTQQGVRAAPMIAMKPPMPATGDTQWPASPTRATHPVDRSGAKVEDGAKRT
jgi:hypothetical protein